MMILIGIVIFTSLLFTTSHSYINYYGCCKEKVLYVHPERQPNTSCPDIPCETLDHYARVSHSNQTHFVLMPGQHTLSTNFNLQQLSYIVMSALNNSMSYARVKIDCAENLGFNFVNIEFLTIQHLSISHCGQRVSIQ